jgi:CO/xanthine dehydrogenase Mo-binding subunit
MCEGLVQRGDVTAGLAAADVVVEGTFETGFIEHAYIEPEAGFARRVGDRIEIHACTQAPFLDRDGTAEVMGLPPESVRIVPTAVGGGFGSKLDLSVQPYVALAAWKLNRPVRIAYARTESMQSTTKRHPSRISLRVGATRDGRIVGFDFDSVFNTGAYASWGPTVANRVPVHASGPYHIGNYRARSRGVHTHCAPAGAFRGFGVPQSAIAQEALFDELADALGLDRLEFRRRNALDDRTPTVTGHVFGKGVGIGACLDAIAPHWERARREAADRNAAGGSNGSMRRGVGVASGWYGCGNTSLPNPSTIKAGVRADGTVVLHQGAMDIGQGANTVIAQIFAEALGVAAERLEIVGGDTDVTPDAGKTSASRQTFVTGNAARLAGEALRTQILRLGNVSSTAEIVFETGAIRLVEGGEHRRIDLATRAPDAEGYVLRAEETYDPPTKPLDANGQGVPYAQFGYAVHLAELEVDVALGVVRLIKFTAAHDVGRAINPILVEGQVQGGIAQGVGMALMEEFIPGRTENLHDYLIPTFGDIPPIETLIVEVADAHGPYGAKGLGEHVLIPTAPAILNAIRDATGARIRKLPATPDRVRAAIRAASQ